MSRAKRASFLVPVPYSRDVAGGHWPPRSISPAGPRPTAQTLNTGETGTVTSPGQLVVSGSRAITLSGGGVVVTNSGTIQSSNSSGRALDTKQSRPGQLRHQNSPTAGSLPRLEMPSGSTQIRERAMSSWTIRARSNRQVFGANNGQATGFQQHHVCDRFCPR